MHRGKKNWLIKDNEPKNNFLCLVTHSGYPYSALLLILVYNFSILYILPLPVIITSFIKL